MKTTPQPLKGSKWPAVLVLSLVSVYLLIGFNKGLIVYDEGLAVYGADRVLHGDIPYKDFWTLYGPANFYVLAALFKLFGTSLIVERFYELAIVAAIIALSYIIARRFASRGLALIAPACSAVWLYTPGSGPDNPALAFTLLSLLFVLNYFSTKRRSWLFAAGLSIGVVFLYRHDQGAIVGIVALILSTLYAGIAGQGREKGLLSSLKAAMFLLSGSALVVLPVAAWLFKSVPARYLVEMFITYPLKVYPAVRSLPFPPPFLPSSALPEGTPLFGYVLASLKQVQFYYPIAVCALAIVFLAMIRSNRKIGYPSVEFFATSALLAYTLCLLARMMTRADAVHLRGVIVMASVLMPAIAIGLAGVKRMKIPFWTLVLLTGLIPMAGKAAVTVYVMTNNPEDDYSFSLERARGITGVAGFAAYEDLIRYVRYIVPADEKIFVGNLRHDLIFGNDSMLYFLAERQCATKYNELDPGVANTERVQREIIADLERNDVNVVVLAQPVISSEPNASSKSTGVVILDEYIQEKYAEDLQFGGYTLYTKR